VAGRLDGVGFSDRFPGARVMITSGVDAHHSFARYAWRITVSDGSTLLEGSMSSSKTRTTAACGAP